MLDKVKIGVFCTNGSPHKSRGTLKLRKLAIIVALTKANQKIYNLLYLRVYLTAVEAAEGPVKSSIYRKNENFKFKKRVVEN